MRAVASTYTKEERATIAAHRSILKEIKTERRLAALADKPSK